ncbi:hypothetical protein [Pendulispora albinea]|uniref:Uncharacterized protein n=1 Tax=Pendulispora albinea TaxID=2741071 RepID=A0ABZ2LU39_9BACT
MRRRRLVSISVAALLATALTAVLALSIASCTQNTTQRAVSSFEMAQKVDFVCIQLFERFEGDAPGLLRTIPPTPAPAANCPPAPAGLTAEFSRFHLFALVTQLARGEVAVVDLSGQAVIDIDRGTPGINFLPVGAKPTDVAVSPDGKMSFVATAETNKYAIYALPNRDVLGDWPQTYPLPPESTRPIPTLTTWPVCALPQQPLSVSVIPRGLPGDGTVGGGSPESNYEVAVVLPGDGRRPSQLITLDPKPFLRGADPLGTPDAERLEKTAGPRIEPGSLDDCKIAITGAVNLSGDLPSSWNPGPAWGNGIPKDTPDAGDAGAESTAAPLPMPPTPGCAAPPSADGGTAPVDAGAPVSYPLAPAMRPAPQGTYVARDGQILYVADGALPLIHVFDLSKPGSPRELAPLLATSQLTPERLVSLGQIAVSPPTRDYKKFLYAVDRSDGSIMVYDVTDPATSPRVPLTRPNPELNPFQPPDRIAFGSPIAAVSFARHDFSPRDQFGNVLPGGYRGALCNPNPRASFDPSAPDFDPGTLFRANMSGQSVNPVLGPLRMRGIFAFVTLTNGRMIAIDVDDWDSPCRRPIDLSDKVSDTTLAQTDGPGNLAKDAYHVKVATSQQIPTVTDEYYFPMGAPHRSRSKEVVRVDATYGSSRVPTIDGRPRLVLNGASLPAAGVEGGPYPLMVPTKDDFLYPGKSAFPPSNFDDTSPGVRFSFEAPEVHFEQSWAVVYEGVLPGMEGYTGTLKRTDDFQTITLSQPNVLFCRKGIEDYRIGQQRASDVLKAEEALQTPQTPLTSRDPKLPLEKRIADYVQITDEILDVADPYWGADNNDDGGSCWDKVVDEGAAPPQEPRARHDFCAAIFGGYAGQQRPSVFRDFPILEAYDDHLVLGRYGYETAKGPPSTSNRVVVGRDRSNAQFVSQLKCCFHNQAHFKIRTGGQWVTQSTFALYSHHVVKDEATGACVQSCATRDRLMNSRAPAVRSFDCADSAGKCREDSTKFVGRNSPLAMRNAALSFMIFNGHLGAADVVPERDTIWQFQTRGGYGALTLNLAGSSVAMSPQSMKFVEPFQQMAVVDGSSQGLIMVDLNNYILARSPYF